ncbi:MAG TPA: calcium-binding protein [Thermoleophilaceae bacterium]|nr:calcium-binding protein [Thermoleophilaceae bacterium]
MRARTIAAGIALAAAAVALPAGAAAPEATVRMRPNYLLFHARNGEANDVRVHIRGGVIEIEDRGVPHLGLENRDDLPQCERESEQKVVCPRRPGRRLVVDLRDRDDSFVATRASGVPNGDFPAIRIGAGSGDDTVRGSSLDELIEPNGGADAVDAGGGRDELDIAPDGRPDRLGGGRGYDTLRYERFGDLSRKPVELDLGAGTARVAGDTDAISGIERAHGGPGNDVLRGSGDGDALYGEGGRDKFFGEGGNDLLVGDGNDAFHPFRNAIWGGDGSDVIDSRGYAEERGPSNAHRTSLIRCGGGHDREMGETDDRLDRSCESAIFGIGRRAFRDVTATVWPARDGDGSLTYEVECPTFGMSCSGSIVLRSPPPAGQGPDVLYGSGSYDGLAAGARRGVHVELNADGRRAAVDRQPIDVEWTQEVDRGDLRSRTGTAGWEQVLGPG